MVCVVACDGVAVMVWCGDVVVWGWCGVSSVVCLV